ncbi:Wadjet anti-phage system protein JetA family protein [Pseudoxanthomonas sp. J31]|uniref:Wadjet anti-phage system protein JetA family protein n=1 Tax=Pseudoxanthomonas sp. J31 TaxID=935851 RepID=UPI0003F51DA4|nr:Wadjet anti-phage system protein JetA family protein [Pseudoxanthomonas sp. J31]
MSSTAFPSLFAHVPAGAFGPLASPNRERYWRLLCRLFDEYFGPDAPLPPSHGFARREIVAALERYLLAEETWEDEGETPLQGGLAARAAAVYERLRQAGWLRQDKLGAREMVLMPPALAQLLGTLVEFADRGPTFVSAKIRSIELQLQQVADGRAGGEALDEAAEQARRLLSSLASMSLQVRDLMPELVRSETTAQFARQWFERYVAQFFIRDYADLHRADHPLARRAQILLMVQEIENGPLREDIAAWYREHVAEGDDARARQLLQRSLMRLRELERIDEYLARLDEDMRQANRRALAFLDYRLRAPDRLDVLLHRAARGALAADENALRMPVGPGGLMDETQLRAPRRRPQPIPRSANSNAQPSAEQIARLSLLRRMKRVRLVTAEDMASYVGRQLPPGGSVDSGALEISSIQDLRAYQTLLTLALRGSRPGGLRRDDPLGRLLRGFRVELVDRGEPGDNGWLRAPRFVVHHAAGRGPSASNAARASAQAEPDPA